MPISQITHFMHVLLDLKFASLLVFEPTASVV
jgi:hypothetical protein